MRLDYCETQEIAMDHVVDAIRGMAHSPMLETWTHEQIRNQLLAILGETHSYVEMDLDSRKCAVCHRDLQHPCHRRDLD